MLQAIMSGLFILTMCALIGSVLALLVEALCMSRWEAPDMNPVRALRRWLYRLRLKLVLGRRVPVVIRTMLDDLCFAEVDAGPLGKLTACGFSQEEAVYHLSQVIEQKRQLRGFEPRWYRCGTTSTQDYLIIDDEPKRFFFSKSFDVWIRKTDGRRFKYSSALRPAEPKMYFMKPLDNNGADLDAVIEIKTDD